MRRRSTAFTLTLLMMASSVMGQTSLLQGTWKLNLAKSTYSPGPPPKTQTIKWEPVPGGLKFTADAKSAQDLVTHNETIESSDGKPGSVQGVPVPTTRALKRIDDHTYEDADTIDGKISTTRKLVISRDGKVLTITAKGTNAQGQAVNNVTVYDKQ